MRGSGRCINLLANTWHLLNGSMCMCARAPASLKKKLLPELYQTLLRVSIAKNNMI